MPRFGLAYPAQPQIDHWHRARERGKPADNASGGAHSYGRFPAGQPDPQAVRLEQNEHAVDDEEKAEPTRERAGRQSLQEGEADRHSDETASDIGQRAFALGCAAQHHLIAQRANGQELVADGQQHDQRDCLQRRQQPQDACRYRRKCKAGEPADDASQEQYDRDDTPNGRAETAANV